MSLPTRSGVNHDSLPANGTPWRQDIQGLRAVAVLAVVAFHANLPVPGGFTGVDVFFVISGFVITAMLQREWKTHGRLRLKRFYWRRFKRLTPALATMVSVTVVLSTFILSPFGPQQDAALTGISALLITANVAIFQTSGGYFDAPAEGNPLLNTWSLSVEEQIYLVFPLLLIVLWTVASRHSWRISRTTLIIAVTAAISFTSMVLASLGQSNRTHELVSSFYSPFDRYWEFAAGALLAVNAGRLAKLQRGPILALRITGATMLVLSFWAITKSTPFPSIWTLLPVLGTVLMIASGCSEQVPPSRLLASRTFTKGGDWSYSIYLWHWPLIVFAGLIWPGNGIALVLTALASVVPAAASFRFIENPIRYRTSWSTHQRITLVATTTLPPIVLSAAVLTIVNNYWNSVAIDRFSNVSGELGYDKMDEEVANSSFPCTLDQISDNDLRNLRNPCVQSKEDGPIDIAILGDSHAHQLFLGLSEALPDKNVLSVHAWGWPDGTSENTSQTLEQIIESKEISAVFINAYWGQKQRVPTSEIRRLAESGKHVYVLDDFPTFSFNPQACKFRSGFLLGETTCREDTSGNLPDRDRVVQDVEETIAGIPNVALVRTHELLCIGSLCDMTRGDLLLYSDDDHLNTAGSRYVGQEIVRGIPDLHQSISH